MAKNIGLPRLHPLSQWSQPFETWRLRETDLGPAQHGQNSLSPLGALSHNPCTGTPLNTSTFQQGGGGDGGGDWGWPNTNWWVD